jgi:predicted protein tyrosine phosphatase
MIKGVIVLSRLEVARILETDAVLDLGCPWVLISIYSDTTGPLIADKALSEILYRRGCHDFETYEFHDITLEKYTRLKALYKNSKKKLKVFSKRQARGIVAFIDKYQRDPQKFVFIVHCEAGVSRSGAVGTFACRYLGLDEHRFRAINENIRPNAYVYDTLCAVSKLKGKFSRFWEEVSPEGTQINW